MTKSFIIEAENKTQNNTHPHFNLKFLKGSSEADMEQAVNHLVGNNLSESRGGERLDKIQDGSLCARHATFDLPRQFQWRCAPRSPC